MILPSSDRFSREEELFSIPSVLLDLLIGQIFQIFFGIVDGYFQLGNKVRQLVPAHFTKRDGAPERWLSAWDRAAEPRASIMSITASAWVKSQPAVEKGSFGKFAAAGRRAPFSKASSNVSRRASIGAVNLDFHHVFAGVGMGCLHVHRQPPIYPLVLPDYMAEVERAGSAS